LIAAAPIAPTTAPIAPAAASTTLVAAPITLVVTLASTGTAIPGLSS
jgi:hypothetical protein